jgi:hypothetical protein
VRDIELVHSPSSHLFGTGRLDEQLDRLTEVPLRFLDRVALAGDVEFGAEGDIAVFFPRDYRRESFPS